VEIRYPEYHQVKATTVIPYACGIFLFVLRNTNTPSRGPRPSCGGMAQSNEGSRDRQAPAKKIELKQEGGDDIAGNKAVSVIPLAPC
jgi:hypothetical protein